MLLASSTVLSNRPNATLWRETGLQWCDTFVAMQQKIITQAASSSSHHFGGYWDTGYNELYLADTGTAVTTLALCHQYAKSQLRKQEYVNALDRFDSFVTYGSTTVPSCNFTPNCSYDEGKGQTCAGWVREDGSLGDGYYKGSINLTPYTIATATVGGAFYAEMYRLKKCNSSVLHKDQSIECERYRTTALNAVSWLLESREQDGSIPYIITPPATGIQHTYQSISYSAEAFIDASLRFQYNLSSLDSTALWLCKHQGIN